MVRMFALLRGIAFIPALIFIGYWHVKNVAVVKYGFVTLVILLAAGTYVKAKGIGLH